LLDSLLQEKSKFEMPFHVSQDLISL